MKNWPGRNRQTMPATSRTICIGSAYWRVNVCQRDAFFASSKRVLAELRPPRIGLGAGQALVDRRPSGLERLVGAQGMPGGAGRPRPPMSRRSPLRSQAAATAAVMASIPFAACASWLLLRLAFACQLRLDRVGRDASGAWPSSSTLAAWSASRASRLTRGKCGSISISALARTPAAATRANGLSSAGMTYQGAHVRARLRQHVAERLLVVVPVGPFLGIVGRELPVLPGLVDPGQEAAPLLLLAQVEEQLDDPIALVGQVALPVVDLAEAPLPDPATLRARRDLLVGEDLGMDPDDQDLLVVRAVEDPDVAALRELPGVPPQVVVVEVRGRRDLEAVDLDALGVDPAHDVADRPVLAGGVHRLEHDDDAVGVLRREPHLVLGQLLTPWARMALASRTLTWRVPDGSKSCGRRTLRPGSTRNGIDELRDPLRSDVRHGRPSSCA